MEFQVRGDGKGFEVRLLGTWHSIRALLKAIVPVIITLVALLAIPEVNRLLILLGW